MVYQDQNRIVSIGGGQQISDEIHQSMRKEAHIVTRWHWHESKVSRVSINLEVLAFKTASNIIANEGT